MRSCSILDCASPYLASGYCNKHYQRWRKHGDPQVVKANHGNRTPRPKPTERTCKDCGLVGDLSLFVANRNLCKRCSNAYKVKWAEENPEKYAAILERSKATQRRYEERRRARRAGQDPDLIEKYRSSHRGRCEICKRRPSGKRPMLYIDHCHKTGLFRGLICSTCNSGLGHFKDNPAALRAAAKYLERMPIDLATLMGA